MAEISIVSGRALRRIKTSLQSCKLGNHDLVDIASHSHWDGESMEVRWCRHCGSVVIDRDYDGRVQPGGIMAMKSPTVAKLTQNL